MSLCLICLRTDRLLKVASKILQEFHEELCDFSTMTMASSCYYCSECEYLLKKFYKFKQKCVEALKIYQKWMSANADKKHQNDLYTLLSPSPLGKWDPRSDTENIGNYTFQSEESQTDLIIEEDLTNDTYAKEVKIEYEDSYDSDSINKLTNALKNENITESVKSEKQLLFENIDELLEEFSDAVTSENEESTDLNSTKPKTEVLDQLSGSITSENEDSTDISDTKSLYELSDKTKKCIKPEQPTTKKNTAKIKEKLIQSSLRSKKSLIKKIAAKKNEKILSKKPLVKKITRKKKAYLEKYTENDKVYQSVFEVEYLTTLELKLQEFERRKTYNHYVKAEHKCEICYQVVKSLKFLEYHMNKWHSETPGSVLCPICKTWNSKSSKHMGTHVVVFKCKLCPLVTHRRTSMKNHFEQHRGKQYHCEQCNITYKSNSAYRNHTGRVHRQGRNICEGCGRGFGSPSGLTIHKNNSFRCTASKETSLSDGVRCEECDVTLASAEVYNAHINDVHVPKRQSRIQGVNSDGSPESKVPKSRKRIRRTPEHICRVCSKVGVSFGWLQLHFKREHPNEDIDGLYADKKTHLCDICGTGFACMLSLRDHMNIHTGDRPYACDVCPKRFRNAQAMKEHRARHFPAAVPCTYCGKKFKTKANLYSHMMTHTGEKNHKCDICGKGFVMRCNLNEHVRGVHFNIRRAKRGGAREGVTDSGGKNKRRKIMAADGETDSDRGDSE